MFRLAKTASLSVKFSVSRGGSVPPRQYQSTVPALVNATHTAGLLAVPVFVSTQSLAFTIDTGAEINLLSENALLTLRATLRTPLPMQPGHVTISGPEGRVFQPLGSVLLKFRFQPRTKPVTAKFYVLRGYALPSDGLLGLPSLSRLRVHIFPDSRHVTYRGARYQALSTSRSLLTSVKPPDESYLVGGRPVTSSSPDGHVPLIQDVHSPSQPPTDPDAPHTVSLASALESMKARPVSLASDVIFSPHSATFLPLRVPKVADKTDVLIIAESVRVRGLKLESGVNSVNSAGQVFALIHNVTHSDISLRAGTCIGEILPYPAPMKECSLPDSLLASSLIPASQDAFPEFSDKVRPLLNPTEYPTSDNRLLQLLFDNSAAVALPGEALGCTHLLEHRIDLLPDARPVYIPAYRLPHSQREIAQRKIQEMIDDGVVEPSTSPWNSPLFLVPKKDGDYRPVVDFRRLNQLTASQRYPLPVLTDLLQSLGDKNAVFSSLDLMSGFWQVPLAPESRPLTAFSTPAGHFQYVRLPMGLKNSPVVFQLLINEVFRGILGQGVFAYLDDVIVVSPDMETHFARLQEVLARISQAGLKIKLAKCHFLRKRLAFLGHVVDSDGLHTSDDKIKAVRDFPRPTTVTELKSFLGLSGYYRPFVPRYAAHSAPLLRLLKKDAPFIWREEQEKAFTSLKHMLTTAPVLAHPDFSQPFVLATDASGQGLGAVLMQLDNRGKHRPIAFASRILTSAESRYSITELETLAIVWALRHFRDLIYGYDITVHTDHQAIKGLFKGKNLSGRLSRWLVILEDYQPKLEYVPGKCQVVADALSRSAVAPLISTTPTSSFSEATLFHAQRHDPLWGQVIHALESNDTARLPGLPCPPSQLTLNDGLLVHLTPDFHSSADGVIPQLVIPALLVSQVLALVHDSVQASHPGVDRTIKAALARYWWPSLRHDVRSYVSSCHSCIQHKSAPSHPVPMGEYPIPARPWDTVSVDLLKLPRTHSGLQYLFVCTDHFSRFVVLAPLKDKAASSVAHAFITHVINPFTTPKVILSDNGAEFRNDLLAQLCLSFGIQQTFIVAHHPASNGLCERANRKILEALRHVTDGLPQTWDQWLSHIAASINSAHNSSINESPHFVLFGVDKRLPYDVLLSGPQPVYNSDDYVRVQLSCFQRIHQAVRKHLQLTHAQYLARQHKSARPLTFQVGDIVYLQNFARDSKLAPKHLGPYRILAQAGNRYTLLHLTSFKECVAHGSNLRAASLREDAPLTPPMSPIVPSSPSPPSPRLAQPRPLQEIFPNIPRPAYRTRAAMRRQIGTGPCI